MRSDPLSSSAAGAGRLPASTTFLQHVGHWSSAHSPITYASRILTTRFRLGHAEGIRCSARDGDSHGRTVRLRSNDRPWYVSPRFPGLLLNMPSIADPSQTRAYIVPVNMCTSRRLHRVRGTSGRSAIYTRHNGPRSAPFFDSPPRSQVSARSSRYSLGPRNQAGAPW